MHRFHRLLRPARLTITTPSLPLRLARPGPRPFRALSSATALAAPGSAPPGPSLEQLSPLLDRMDGLAVIGGFDKFGFNVNGVRMRGSVLVFSNFALLWNVGGPVDVSPRALAPLHMVHPKPELVLVGTGYTTRHVNPAVYAYMARHGIAVEVMGTVRARGGGCAAPFARCATRRHAPTPPSPPHPPHPPRPHRRRTQFQPSTSSRPRAAPSPPRWCRWSK